MAKRVPAIPLSKMHDGLNRFDQDIGENQSLEGEDVIANKGYLRRREAFSAILLGPIFRLPPGMTIIAHTPTGGSTTYHYDRTFTLSGSLIGGLNGDLDIFCEETFDGIAWDGITNTLTSVTANSSIALKYLTAGGLVAVPWCLDTTKARFTNGSVFYHQSLCQQGRISWHQSQLTGWTTVSIGGRSYYQIRVGLLSVSGSSPIYGGALAGSGNLIAAAPGPTAFVTEPVRTILPVNILGNQQILACADRQDPRGSESGAAIGVSKRERAYTKNAFLVAQQGEGAGVINGPTFPEFFQGNAAATWSSGYTAQGGGPLVEGVLTHLLKNVENDDWYTDQFRGAVVYEGLSPVPFGTVVNDSTTRQGRFSFIASVTIHAKQWEQFRIKCTANVSGTGTPVGEERAIITNTSNQLRFMQHFSVAPDTQNTFSIIRPHHVLLLNASAYDGLEYEITSNTGRRLTFAASDYAPAWTTTNGYGHFQIGREFQWSVRRGRIWSASFDTLTKKYLLTNGESGLIEYDSNRFRELTATSDSSNARVQLWTGILEDLARLNATDIVAGSEVDVYPAKSKYVIDFNQRIVCANLQNAPYEVKWSAPNFFNDIWPKIYRASIRDAENNPITGMASLGNRLLVFTPTSIHEAAPADDKGMLTFRPIIQGVGFISNASVAKVTSDISSALIGAAVDGVYVVAGTSVASIIDQWERYLPQGVNSNMLWASCGAVSLKENLYFLAVPSAGSNVNNKLLAINLSTRSVQVWNAPWGGIASIARDTDDYGRERILFGTNDGHIAILVNADTDDGDTITGWSRSGPYQLSGGTLAFTSMEVTATDTGTQTLTIKSFVDRKGAAKQEASLAFSAGAPVYGTGLYDAALWAGEHELRTRKVMFPAGTRGENFQFEIRGTGQWQFKQAELIAKPMGQRSK